MGHTLISFWERLYNIVLLRTYLVWLPGKYTQRLRRAGLASAAVPLRGPRPQPAVCFLSSIKWPRTDHAMPFPPQARAIGMAWRLRWTCQQSCHHQTILTFVYFALLESGFMTTVFLKMTRLKTLSIELFVSAIFSKSDWNNQRMFSDKRCLSSAFALRCLSLLTEEILS